MSRPVVILLVLVAVALAILFGLAAMDREVPQTRIEKPVANAPKP